MSSCVLSRINKKIKDSSVLVFLKGTRETPQCRFSIKIIEIMDNIGVECNYVDVLQSDELRDGLKKYSDWPTFPQLYIMGEFIGGCDIVTEMYRTGELQRYMHQLNIIESTNSK